MAQCFVLNGFRSVFYSVSHPVGGPSVGVEPTDVMLVQYLLNRYTKNFTRPYGAHRPLAVDGRMGVQTHYRLLHFTLFTYGAQSADPPDPHHCVTFINPIENLHTNISPAEVVATSPMGRLMFKAFLEGLPTPSFDGVNKPSQLTLPDMPPLLAQDLDRNVAVY